MTIRNPVAARSPAATASAIDAPQPRSIFSWRYLLAATWPVAMIVWIYAAFGRLGFYPTDEGLMQAYTYRILHGQVPHRDFISPRPLGSALLHIVDFLIPGPLFEVSRVVTLIEYVAYGILFACLIYAAAPWRWRVLAAMGAAGSILLNLNYFPLMPWYTVDGLLLVAAGCVLIASGTSRRSARGVGAGFLVVGLAALTKQSFVPAPAFAWLLMWPWLKSMSWLGRLRALIVTGLLAAVPSLVFIAVIAALGGFHELRTQLLSGQFVYGRGLLSAWSPRHDFYVIAPLFLATALLTATAELAVRRSGPQWAGLSVLSRFGVSALVIAVALWQRLGVTSIDWATQVAWILIAVVLTRFAIQRSFDPVGWLTIGVVWMSMLSWGWPWPTFGAGTGALYVLHRSWSDFQVRSGWEGRLEIARYAAAAVALLLTFGVFTTSRDDHIYLDRPAGQLTASLNDISPAFGSIRTNPQTHEYLSQIVTCVNRYPARRVAVIPDNAAIYPALGLKNPFPIDWMWPDDMRSSEGRVLAVADQLNSQGDYLVLFQTVGPGEIVNSSSVPDAVMGEPIHAGDSLPAQIYARLGGQRSVCGSFLVVYSPPS